MMHRLMKICVLLLCGVFAVAAFAQNANSTISGTVQDTHGAVVPGATIELTNVGTGQTLTTTSRANGFYTFTNLSPADYKVSTSAPGFAQWIGTLTLRVSQAASIDPQLSAASVSTKVTVRDVTPVIDRVNATLSDVKNATTIETLPVSGRKIINVLAFSPGVVAGNYGGSGAGFTRVNGIPGGSLSFLVDGQTAANRFSNELQTNSQPIPTFQEAKIITTSGDAQYSRPGTVELVTKSGTNKFHGQAFELNRNNFLNAHEAFSGPTIAYLMHNEFGGQVGGPIKRDHTFFFFDAEWIRENANANVHYTMVPTEMRTGNLAGLVDAQGLPVTVYDPHSTSAGPAPYTRTPFAGNVIPAARLNSVSQQIFTQYLPAPNIDNAYWEGDPNYRPTSASASQRNKFYTAKVDQLFGANRLAMRYTYTNDDELQPRSEYYVLEPAVVNSGGHNGAIVFTQIMGPHVVNVLRAGVQYNHQFSGPLPISPSPQTELGLPVYNDSNFWPSFYFQGANDGYWSGIDRGNPKDYPDQTISASDQLSYNRGNHQFMFGFNVSNLRITTTEVGQPGGGYDYNGNFTALQDPAQVALGTYDAAVPGTGSGLADFLLGDTDSVNLNNYPVYHTRQTNFSGFAQDNWRATQKLTLNLGLRYEYWTAFADASGRASTFDPTVPGGLVVYQGSGALPAYTEQAVYDSFVAAGLPIASAADAGFPLSLYNMPHNNFAPRLGFAYQIDDKTVLRGGWGIYQWAMPLVQYQQQSRKNPPFSYSVSYGVGQVNGVSTNAAAAQLEFPNAAPEFGGPQPLDQFQLGSPTLVLDTSKVHIQQGGGFGIAPMNPDYKLQTVQEYNLTFARELPWNVGFQLSYIGNHATNLPQGDPINYTVPRENCVAAQSPDVAACQAGTAKFRRAFPVFSTSSGGNMQTFNYDGYSNTNSLQAQVTRTFGGGLTLQSYFTWARTLTTTEGAAISHVGNTAEMIPASLTPGFVLSDINSGTPYSERQRLMYAPDSYLPTKTFSFNAHYEFPFGQGKRFLGNAHGFLNALVSGYNIAPFFLWHSGFYFAPYWSVLGSNTVLAPGKTGILPKGDRTRDQWFDASIAREDQGDPYNGETYIRRANTLDNDFRNNVPRNYMTGPGFNRLDATIYKLTPITANTKLDIEAQIFNVYNHQNLGKPNNNGIIRSTVGGARVIQLQAKYIF